MYVVQKAMIGLEMKLKYNTIDIKQLFDKDAWRLEMLGSPWRKLLNELMFAKYQKLIKSTSSETP